MSKHTDELLLANAMVGQIFTGIASMASTRVAEAIMAAPTPWTRRKTMSQPTPGARPHRTELTVMTTKPVP